MANLVGNPLILLLLMLVQVLRGQLPVGLADRFVIR